ncbi:putative mediator of RNA polymerase II transcription subunit 12 [Drosophila elegans]|uniref:putative mediator of RNA polymerase II transcription subunit 12 n=1 Tax=Drosophila elegans TaxID=30023 RepID=UPI0007E6C009|nr:putative mediator of RNA polymerase II transcription subunit 12 [Drosophila elegans]
MIYALMWLSLAMTMEAIDGDAPVPLSLAEFPILPLEHGKPHYQEEETGLAGYTQNYYGPTDTATADDLATYGNYAHKLLAATHSHAHHIPHPIAATSTSSLDSTANGFVPFHYSAKLHSQFTEDEEPRRDPSAHIDFVINAANYEPNSAGFEEVSRHREPFESHAYRVPRLPFPTSPPGHYHFEQISNYRENRQQEERQEQQDDSSVYARTKELQALANPVKRQLQREESPPTHHQNQDLKDRHQHQQLEQYQPLEGRQLQHQQQHIQLHQQQKLQNSQDQRQQQRLGVSQDQQLLYSHKDIHQADLPAVTTSVRYTPESSKAIAGLPLAKHIEITKNVPVTHYQKQHVPYKQTIQVQVPRTVIAAIPKPLPIKIPVAQTVAVPQLQEVKIPIERVKPVPVEQPIPFVVERRVPYRVEKPVVSPVYYPYPVKVPVVRTVVHKQRPHPHYVHPAPGWSATGNHLLG